MSKGACPSCLPRWHNITSESRDESWKECLEYRCSTTAIRISVATGTWISVYLNLQGRQRVQKYTLCSRREGSTASALAEQLSLYFESRAVLMSAQFWTVLIGQFAPQDGFCCGTFC